MPIPRKPDSDRIAAHLTTLAHAPWIGTARRTWPKYVYHFAELKNVLSILRCGELRARSLRPMVVDTASASVISHTDSRWQSHVRLYFRPKTPTQFQCEGFRPTGQYGTAGAHSPMPFVLLFDAEDILTRESTQFSDGNLSRPTTQTGGTAEFLEALPFHEIYHDGPFAAEERDRIVNRRHAEVCVPERLSLEVLRYIWCRSPAEFQTLFHLLDVDTYRTYSQRIGIAGGGVFHIRKWTYVEEVTLEQNRAVFRFNPSSLTPGPFDARIAIKGENNLDLVWNDSAFRTDRTPEKALILTIPQVPSGAYYEITLTFDGNPAYSGLFVPDTDVPF